jgi:hypothetical protein
MATWGEFAAAEPELAAAGERLLMQSGVGMGFLGTVRADGGPRVHLVSPMPVQGRLYVFIVEMSPKKDDLLRDGRYALHALPPPEGGEEFYVTGRATLVQDNKVQSAVAAAFGRPILDFELLFELGIRRVLHTTWENWGTAEIWPSYRRWRAPQVRR